MARKRKHRFTLEYDHPVGEPLVWKFKSYRFLAVSETAAIERLIQLVSKTNFTDDTGHLRHARPRVLSADIGHRQIPIPWDKILRNEPKSNVVPFPSLHESNIVSLFTRNANQ